MVSALPAFPAPHMAWLCSLPFARTTPVAAWCPWCCAPLPSVRWPHGTSPQGLPISLEPFCHRDCRHLLVAASLSLPPMVGIPWGSLCGPLFFLYSLPGNFIHFQVCTCHLGASISQMKLSSPENSSSDKSVFPLPGKRLLWRVQRYLRSNRTKQSCLLP